MSVSKEKEILLSEEDISILFSIGLVAQKKLKLDDQVLKDNINSVIAWCFEEAKKENILSI